MSIFQKQIGIFPLEISKCPYIGELFLSTRASYVSLRQFISFTFDHPVEEERARDGVQDFM